MFFWHQIKVVVFLFLCSIIYAAPMESMSEYNVVLIHGAGSHWGGLDCVDEIVPEAADITGRIGGVQGRSSATGMIKELKPWIQDTLFNGDYNTLIYLQRPFTNPANSPSNNGNEIGKRTWMGSNKCSKRRSLFEEAQEIQAGGQNKLDTLRKDSIASYRKIPSRNIIVSHSMGGVAAREYVQGGEFTEGILNPVIRQLIHHNQMVWLIPKWVQDC